MAIDPLANPLRWQRLDALFHEALKVPIAARAKYLDDACSGDRSLRETLERLLAFDQAESASFTARGGIVSGGGSSSLRAAVALDGSADTGDLVGKRVGPYRLNRLIASGGMGAVWHGERADDQYRMAVAIKLIRWSTYDSDLLRRFRTERQLLANLDHANIARLLDGGVTDDGAPYLVMEYVEGHPITRYCSEQELATRGRLALFRKVCAAVQHAHRHLIVHRDLKPNNILVTAAGEPKLLDFGIAKVLEDGEPSTPRADATQNSAALMTPRYASPEQIDGAPITTASDIYALGTVLYEILSGQPVHPPDRRLADLFRAIRESAPTRPSSINPELDRDLDAIVLKALSKEPERRYASVDALEADIRRYLVGEPVRAHPPSVWYPVRKFVRRNRLAVGLLAMIATLIPVIGVGGWLLAARAANERDQALAARAQEVVARATAQEITRFLQEMLASAQPQRIGTADLTVRELLDAAGAEIDTSLADQPDIQSAVRLTVGDAYRSLGFYEDAERHLRAALETRLALHADDHPDVLEAIDRYATLLQETGKYADAESRFRAVLAARRAENPRAPLAIALAENNLALLLDDMGHYNEAETLLRAALAARRGALGTDAPLVAASLASLAATVSHQGRHAESEELLEEALTIHRRARGDAHLDTIKTLAELGTCLLEQDRLDAAESRLRAALDGFEAVLGPEHPDTVKVLNNLAGVLTTKESWEAARQLLERALAVRRDVLGPEHPDVAIALNNLAAVTRRQGDLERAETLYMQALEVARNALGPQHPLVATTLNNVAFVMSRQGKLEAAEKHLRESIEIQRVRLGADHPRYAVALNNLGRLVETQGDLEQAAALYEQALQIRESAPDPDRRTAATLLYNRGNVLVRLERHAEAEPLLRRSMDLRHELHPEDHWQIQQVRSTLGACRAGLGQLDEAETLLTTAHEALQKAGPSADRARRKAVTHLVQLYEQWNKPAEADRWRAVAERNAPAE